MPISLDQMSMLARKLKSSDEAIKEQADELKRVQETARVLREETIPSAMQELGLSELKLDTGEKLTIKQDVYASIPVAHRELVFDWLEKHDFDGLIKTTVISQFGRGELEAANEMRDKLRAQGLDAITKREVHHSTMKAFLREQISNGVDIPLDLFGARPVWTAKLK